MPGSCSGEGSYHQGPCATVERARDRARQGACALLGIESFTEPGVDLQHAHDGG